MTFHCDDLERALASDDPQWLAAARTHATECAKCRSQLELSDGITAAARTMHREWQNEALWPRIAAELDRDSRWSWQWMAAAAVLLLAIGGSVLVMRDRLFPGGRGEPRSAEGRLLSDQALSEVEHAEAQYIDAIEALARKAAAPADRQDTALLMNLRERLLAIDAAIADCRAEIERNRFNAHLRRQLLSIYQEKRRTLEQILEQEQNAS